MKLVTISGGLGNQMFIYAFCVSLRTKKNTAILFAPRFTKSKGCGHQGFELQKLFNIDLYGSNKAKFISLFLKIYSQIIRVFPSKIQTKLFNLIGFKKVTVKENFIYYPEIFDSKNKDEIFYGTWQSEKYFDDSLDLVRNSFQFNELILSKVASEISNEMAEKNSISVHIRRGDYLSNDFINGFGGICNIEYYQNAIDYINSKCEDSFFYFFSDDVEWVKNNFNIKNSKIIDFNKNENSWQDMYLMTKCKHNIIANSSFSWWGAWLNPNQSKIVIAPKKWWNFFEIDDVVPNNWIRI